MKVVFLFMSKGVAAVDSLNDDWKTQQASPAYMDRFGDQSYFKMFQSLFDAGIITDLTVFFESGVHPGQTDFVKGARNYVVPHISQVKEYIDEDTIIFVRGGFRHWHDFLTSYKGKNWLICYAANTGRDKWTWWDIVFDDLHMANEIDRHGRYQFPFIKPTNEDVFRPMADDLKYDICIGASNIYDKKGQYRSVQVLERFRVIFGYYPTAVMPGSVRGSTHTNEMLVTDLYKNDIESPGNLSKPELNKIFAKCRIFMHLGTGGQNDRSILEASAAGLPVIFANTTRFTPLLKDDGITTFVFDMEHTLDEWAFALKAVLDKYKNENRMIRHKVYKEKMGYDEVVMPMLVSLFRILADHPEPKRVGQEKMVKAFDYVKNILGEES